MQTGEAKLQHELFGTMMPTLGVGDRTIEGDGLDKFDARRLRYIKVYILKMNEIGTRRDFLFCQDLSDWTIGNIGDIGLN